MYLGLRIANYIVPPESDIRLSLAAKVLQVLEAVEGREVAEQWMFGAKEELMGYSPATVIARKPYLDAKTVDEILALAHSWASAFAPPPDDDDDQPS